MLVMSEELLVQILQLFLIKWLLICKNALSNRIKMGYLRITLDR